jgi:CTP synthase
MVGEYTGLKDAYKSLIEALSHGGIANKVRVNLDWMQFARERQVPYFGICFGMQMAVIEAARNLCGIEDANSVSTPAHAPHLLPATRLV